ncbi:uncharacterized protein LOC110686153 isoform X2 [Chenopodium quinoa]|uniref:uncharacterized protein LOC110686153 isoform X2 n=1 Tax=Chenopodium quinoa TaxID=63459 RepID=UPI000B78A020|nr:uncharacterized protein LOC110686153 isoform X2 [Chenopodium quinoa]
MVIQQSQEQTSSSQDVALQATSSKKRSRGPSKAIQSSKPMVLEFNDYDLPTGEWEPVYGKQIGACAKRLDITVNEYAKIDKVDRENIWEETKRMFHIEDPSGERQKRFHSAVASRFSCHKSNLRERFITFKNPYPATSPKANMKPWEVYEGYFTEEKWKRFEIYSKLAEFKEKSEKGKENAKLNKCRHHLGRNSFQRARIIWNKQKRLENRFPALVESSTTGNTSQSSTSTGSIFDRRALEWVLAHEKRLPDGTWGIDPKDTETIRIANIVEENLQKQAKESEEGECKQSERGVDALTLAFGKKDHRGFVKGLGGCGIGVGYRKAFGPVKGKNMSKSGCSLQELDEFKENLTREFEEKLKEGIAAAVNSYLSDFIPHITANDLQVNDAQPSPSSSINPTELSPRLLEVLEDHISCKILLSYN